MKNRFFQTIFLLLSFSLFLSFKTDENEKNETLLLFNSIETNSEKPNFEVFENAINGYLKLKKAKSLSGKNLLTIIDFSLSSNKKRMWVIDLKKKKVLHHLLVAHGRNTGNEFARNFSNILQSKKSSLGFYVTGKTYYGKHGLSLYLDGMEEGFNDNARERSIVIHGAKYVNKNFIKKYGRLGRSFGCPAVSMKIHKEVINLIANKTCLFIYYPDSKYFKNSKFVVKNE